MTRRTSCGLLVLLLLALPLGLWSALPHDQGQLPTTVEQYLEATTSSGVPGVSVTVLQDGKVLHQASSGSLAPGTMVPVASLTKAFTATAVLQLAERGRLRLDDPVRQHLPGFELDDPRSGSITIRQVLNQSSGLTDATLGFNQYSAAPATPRKAVELLAQSRLAYPPGTSWDYCNVNYWIAEVLVEEVTGTPLPEHLQREVLEPLGMHSTVLLDHTGEVPETGTPTARNHSYLFGRAVPTRTPRTFAGGAGGLWTTQQDLARWALFQQGHGPGVGRVLTRGSLREMHRRQSPLHQYSVGYALGWWHGEPADGGVVRTSHSGTGAGHSAYIGLFPDDVAITVVVNATGPRADDIANDLYAIHRGQPRPPLGAPSPVVDSCIAAVAVLACTGCVVAIRRRLRGEVPRQWRGHAVALLCLTTFLLVVLTPSLGTRLVGRQSNWPLLATMAPVPVLGAWLTALPCLGVAVSHLLRAAAGQTRSTNGRRVPVHRD
ncbi:MULTISPECIES: serine hydrolase domain-containing protein [unclassified Luteococcus]|uniref:serine hydrolase domain-containing protein n=1 Tax=unclassified Luteococcus TaxID=2639923 RepID=UPI00313E41D5